MSNQLVDLPLPTLMKRDEFLDYTHLAPKLLALNNWLLDGRMKSGGVPAYQGTRSSLVSSGNFFKATELNKGEAGTPGTTIRELARTAVAIAESQIFEDANHRTATLLILEYLASIGVIYTRNPARIYWLVAERSTNTDTAIQAIDKEVRSSNYKPEGGVTEDRRLEYAVAIKAADDVWTKINAIGKEVQNAKPNGQDAVIAAMNEARKRDLWIYELYLLKNGSPIPQGSHK